MKEYKNCTDGSLSVSDPAVAIGGYAVNSDKGMLCYSDDFEMQWQRALSIENFRNRCVSRLKSMYGEDN